MDKQFPRLFAPLKIGSAVVKNRIFHPALTQTFEDLFDNYALTSERSAHYYAERAKGGVGLLVLGFQMVHPTSTGAVHRVPVAYRKEAIPRYKMVADMVHKHGAKIFAQLAHTGILTDGEMIDDYHQIWGPSAIKALSYAQTPKAMEVEDIKEVIAGFAESARNVQEGDLDGIELHAAHGYLLAQFMSPVCNRRTDVYGGDLDNRMRFLLETIEAVRAAIGPDFPLGVRISGDEFAPGGMTLADTTKIAEKLETLGKIDYINVSVGAFYGMLGSLSPMSVPAGSYAYLAAAVKEVVQLPVFCIGGISDPAMAEQILADSQADMVGMGRALICDPEIPNKARQGRLNEIRHCIYCNQGCAHRVMTKGLSLTCVQNPSAGREKRLGLGTLKPAVRKKRIMVIGAGPAGLKAAEILASRQHTVLLFEKENELGGAVRLAAKLPTRQGMEECIRYLIGQIRILGVQINTATEVNMAKVQEINPDAVIVAAGARPERKIFFASRLIEDHIPGADQKNVYTIPEVLNEKSDPGHRIAIVDDDGTQRTWGMAEWLADRGKSVEIITERPGAESPKLPLRWVDRYYLSRLSEKGVKITTATELMEISGNSMVLLSKARNEKYTVAGLDSFIIIGVNRPNDELYFELKRSGLDTYRIGDCIAPRSIEFAIWEGEEAGRRI
jgi:mycofactocin system FadH/OYE family oxidoreductase 2